MSSNKYKQQQDKLMTFLEKLRTEHPGFTIVMATQPERSGINRYPIADLAAIDNVIVIDHLSLLSNITDTE